MIVKKYGTLASAVVPGILALLFAWGALRMPHMGRFTQAPGFFPLIAAALMLFLSVVLFFQEWGKLKQEGQAKAKPALSRQALIRTVYMVFWMAVFVIMLWFRVPFMLSAGLFLAATLFYFEKKRIVSNLFIIALAACGFYFIFTRFFYIPLP